MSGVTTKLGKASLLHDVARAINHVVDNGGLAHLLR